MKSQNEARPVEIQGIIINARFKIEKALEDRKAFDANTAVDAEEAGVNSREVLDLMARDGLIGRTSEGKIFMTKKGQERQMLRFCSELQPQFIC